MTSRRLLLSLGVAIACCGHGIVFAQQSTKDIVLDRIHAPAAAAAPGRDAMVVSVLVESPDGSLTPRAVNARFRTGDRFRVKMLPSRDGMVALYNTKPTGETSAKPIWRGKAKRGIEVVTPRLRLDGDRGTDKLHVVLEPARDANVFAWLGDSLRATGKDVRLDVQNSSRETFLLGDVSTGLVTTLHITHR